MRRIFGFFKDERGATAVEYGLILAMIFLAMVGAISLVRLRLDRHVGPCRQRGDECVNIRTGH